jgi:Flp pilus assembly protein TadD
MDVLRWPVQAGYLLVVYLQQIVWPTNLACVYPLPAGFFTRIGPDMLLAFAGACVLTGLLALSLRWSPGPLVGWLFFVGSIAPTLGLVKYSWMAASDKYAYFPALGILLVVASGLAVAWRPRRAGGLARTALQLLPVVLILAAEWRGARSALSKWTDSLTLARHMVAGAPDCSHTHLILGVVLAQQGQAEESVQQLQTAAQFAPDDFETVYSLGNSLRLAGRLPEAEAAFRRALSLEPDSFGALDQLGTVLLFQGRAAESVEQFRRAVAVAPGNSIMRYRLAVALLSLGGHSAEAADDLRQVIQAKPDSPAPIGTLAWLLATSPDPAIRKPDEALRLAGRVVELTRSRDPRALETLAAAQAAAGRFAEAIQTAGRAMELAQSHHADDMALGIRERLALYQRGIAYTEPAPVSPRPAR